MSDMTREETIEEIKRWTPILLNSGQCTEKTSEAQDIAISALKSYAGMTNGEVICSVFDVMVLTIKDGKVWVEKIYFPFDEEWWNSPYQQEGGE